jgi:PIN domain-containing protein
VRFFLDNNLAPKLAKSLNALIEPEHQVVHLKDRFAANTPDETWMTQLAREPDWIIISGDIRISKNPHEVEAWRSAGHTTFFLKPGWTNDQFWIQAYKFVKCFPDIIAAAQRAKRGTFFMISTKGKITQ